MRTRRLGSRLAHRVVRGLRLAGELGLACLMTAGVASCGGTSTVLSGDAASDGANDGHPPPEGMPEAACLDCGVHPDVFVEASQVEGGHPDVFVEASNVEGGADGGMIDSSCPAVEAAFFDCGLGSG